MNGFLITIPNPDSLEEDYIDIYLTPHSNLHTDVKIVNGSPYISISGELKGKVYTMNTDSTLLDNSKLNSLSVAANDYLQSMFTAYLYKTSKELKSDINGFGKNALSNFTTTQELEDYNWLSNYEDSFFDINLTTIVESGVLLTQT